MGQVVASVLKVLLLEVLLGVILFGSAGRIDLPWVWVLLVVHTTLYAGAVLRMDPTLMNERMSPGAGVRDALPRRIMTVLILVHLVVAGLDVGRYHWSPPIPLPVRLAALAAFAGGMSLGLWAMVVNRFVSSAVRLQTDRGHHVITTGPYRFVRHPGYAGLLVSATAGAVVIGSWWSLLPLLPAAVACVWRMGMEDRFLQRELHGYSTYASSVRYKLVPGLW